MNTDFPKIYSATGMMELIQKIGFLPLLDSGIDGSSAEDIVDEDCRYVTFPEGGWDWPLWKWKGEIVQEMPCMYGKFFNKKAGFISQEWWPDFCNYRRNKFPRPDEDSIEGTILSTLQSTGSLITRELRAACGFTGKGMRSKFDGYLTRLEMATYIVTEDFIYPRDKHNHEYGWGWSLLNTPEDLYGREAFQCNRTPQESYKRIFEHLKEILSDASDKQIIKLIGYKIKLIRIKMRKKSRAMDSEWALEVMHKAPYITVSFIDEDGKPYGLPLSLASDDDVNWYFHGALEGKKLEAIKAHPEVCLSAVTRCAPTVGPKDGSFTLQFKSAIAFGKAEIVTDEAEKIHGLRLICERFLPQHMDAFDQSIARSLSRTAVVRITLIEPPTGKRKQYDKEGVEMKYGRME